MLQLHSQTVSGVPGAALKGTVVMLALLDLFSPIPVYIFAFSIADLLGFVTFNTAFCALAVQFTNISS